MVPIFNNNSNASIFSFCFSIFEYFLGKISKDSTLLNSTVETERARCMGCGFRTKEQKTK